MPAVCSTRADNDAYICVTCNLDLWNRWHCEPAMLLKYQILSQSQSNFKGTSNYSGKYSRCMKIVFRLYPFPKRETFLYQILSAESPNMGNSVLQDVIDVNMFITMFLRKYYVFTGHAISTLPTGIQEITRFTVRRLYIIMYCISIKANCLMTKNKCLNICGKIHDNT